MFPHSYFAAPMYPNPYFPESQGETPPPGTGDTVNSRRKGASRTHVIPT